MLMDNGKTLTSSGNSYGFQVVGFATPNAKYAYATKQLEAKIYSVNKSIILNLCVSKMIPSISPAVKIWIREYRKHHYDKLNSDIPH